MALTRTLIGNHPDTGDPYFAVVEDDPDRVVLLTGPATGDITMSDGTVYAVDRDVISIEKKHVDEIHHHIERQHEQTGALDVQPHESPTGDLIQFKHSKCAHCKGGK